MTVTDEGALGIHLLSLHSLIPCALHIRPGAMGFHVCPPQLRSFGLIPTSYY